MIPLTMTKTFGKLQKRLLLSCENSLRVRLKVFKYQGTRPMFPPLHFQGPTGVISRNRKIVH